MNNVEGIHGVIKRDARRQFGRLPYLTGDGQPYYLDLLVLRANTKLKKAPIIKAFCAALWRWTKTPLEDLDHTTPVWRDEDLDQRDDDLEERDDELEAEDDEYDLYVPRSDDEEETTAVECNESDFEFDDL